MTYPEGLIARQSRREGLLCAALIIVLLLGLSAPSRAHAAVASRPTAHASSLVDDTVCALIDGESVKGAAKNVLRKGRITGRFGSLLATVVLTTVTAECPKLVSLAERVVGRLFHTGSSPGKTSTKAVWNAALPDLRTGLIASQLGVSPSYVTSSAANLCSAVLRRQNPVATMNSLFPTARLVHLNGLNGVVSLAARRCGLNATYISALNAGVLQLVLSKVSRLDLDPPAAWFNNFASQRISSTQTRITANFGGADRGSGVARFAVWLSYGGQWHLLTSVARQGGWELDVNSGLHYKWAVQAIDRAGNRGPVAYSTVGTA